MSGNRSRPDEEDRFVADGGSSDTPTRSSVDPDSLKPIREESRAVLDHYIDTIRGIDNMAMWLVRTSVIVIGLVISAFGLALSEIANGQHDILLDNWGAVLFGVVGMVLMIGVAGYGSLIFAGSKVPFGPRSTFREESVISDTSEEEILYNLIRGYDRWIPQAQREARKNARAFTRLQICFNGSIFLIVLGAILLLLSIAIGLDQWITLGVGVLAGCLVLLAIILLAQNNYTYNQ